MRSERSRKRGGCRPEVSAQILTKCEAPDGSAAISQGISSNIVHGQLHAPFRPRQIILRDGREVTLRAVVEADAPELVQAFERLSAESRYYRFMRYKKNIDRVALERGVHPRPGSDFAFVATTPAADGFDIVGGGQYVRAGNGKNRICEFAITVAEDWRDIGLSTRLLASLVRRARRDCYETMEGWVMAQNRPMLAVARKLHFKIEPVPGDAAVLRVQRAL